MEVNELSFGILEGEERRTHHSSVHGFCSRLIPARRAIAGVRWDFGLVPRSWWIHDGLFGFKNYVTIVRTVQSRERKGAGTRRSSAVNVGAFGCCTGSCVSELFLSVSKYF